MTMIDGNLIAIATRMRVCGNVFICIGKKYLSYRNRYEIVLWVETKE